MLVSHATKPYQSLIHILSAQYVSKPSTDTVQIAARLLIWKYRTLLSLLRFFLEEPGRGRNSTS